MKFLDKFIEIPKLPFILSGIIFISSLLFLSTNKYTAEQAQIQQRAMAFAFLVGKSSDDLTMYARYHVTTKNPVWREKFEEVLKIRAGEMPDKKGVQKSLVDKAKEIDFSKDELDIYESAVKQSNNLAIRETEAFQLIANLRSGKAYNAEIDEVKAQELMFGNEYQRHKNEIMTTIAKFHDTVKKRTDEKIALSNTIEWSLVTLINLCLLLLVMALKHKEELEKKPVRRVVRKKKPTKRLVKKPSAEPL
jgi:hypothetical protein